MKLKIPKTAVLNILKAIVFGCFCALVGSIATFFILVTSQTNKMAALVEEYKIQVEKLESTIEYHRLWKVLVDERFAEQQGSINKLYFRFQIPMEVSSAADRYKAFRREGK